MPGCDSEGKSGDGLRDRVGWHATKRSFGDMRSQAGAWDRDRNQTYDIVLTAAQEGTPLVGVELISTDLPNPIHQQEAVTITP